jgi:hypothetical protein
MKKTIRIDDILDFRQYLELCKHDFLAKLLIKKGIITEQEYKKATEQGERFAVENYHKTTIKLP